ncbi:MULTISPECIES: hypothetical protein [unclassified Peribacillus]|nr:hypothetical protein [Peribacillus sp. Bi96]
MNMFTMNSMNVIEREINGGLYLTNQIRSMAKVDLKYTYKVELTE